MFTMLAFQADSGGVRVVLLVLVLLAVLLIVAGGVIAMFTLFRQRKDTNIDID